MSKTTITKITQFQNCIVAKAPNKRIIYTKEQDGSILIDFVRVLSKEEQEELKDKQLDNNQQIVRKKAFVTTLKTTDETFENLRVFLNAVTDMSSDKNPITI